MKKALKITGITLASLIGLVLIVVGIAVAMVTSSGRLTQMVKHYAPQFVNCEMELDRANLTLFKTFPHVGVDIEHVALINPMEGSPSDTLANIDDLTVVVDIKKLLKEKKIEVSKCILEKAFVNIYTNPEGNSNLNVFNTKDDADTTNVPFDYLVDLEEIKLENSTLFYINDFSHLSIQVKGFDLNLNGKFQDNEINAKLNMKVDDFHLMNYAMPFALKNVNIGFNGGVKQLDQIEGVVTVCKPDIQLNPNAPSLNYDTLSISLPVLFSLKNLSGHYEKGEARFKDYCLYLDGDVEIAENGNLVFDFGVKSNTVAFESVLSYLPEELQKKLYPNGSQDMMDLAVDNAKVIINSSRIPHVLINIQANDLAVNVSSLPYPILDLNADVLLANDLTRETSNSLEVNNLIANLYHSHLEANGIVDDLSGGILLKLNAKGDVPFSDVKNFLPKTMALKGRTLFNLTTDFTVDNLMKTLEDYNLERLSAKADLKIKNLAFDMDTIHAAAPQLDVNLILPASSKQRGKTGAYVAIGSKALDARMGENINANLKNVDIRLFANNFNGGIDDIKLDATMKFGELGMVYDALVAALKQTHLTLMTTPKKDTKGLNARLTLDSGDVEASSGEGYGLSTHSLYVETSVQQNANKTGLLNQWNPDAKFTLGNAEVKIDGLDENIHISNINFLLNPDMLDFKKCTFRLGQSDLSLRGSVIGIKDWMENHNNTMKGDFRLTTDLLNVKEIVQLINGLNINKDPKPKKAKSDEISPFIVQTGIDLDIDVNTKKTVYGDIDFSDLSGTITMKDSSLILNELRFGNKAAKMQLSALYQSTNKDNLFFAMDFHLMDVQIKDMLHLIPYFDTLVPMLKTFDGQCEFNIDVETNLKSNYHPEISTIRAAADIKGKSLTVNDQFTFTKITNLLGVSTNGEYRVDTLDVQLTFSENKLNIWPSQIAIGKYNAIVDGFMTLYNIAEYHIAVTESPVPLPLGLKLWGPLDKLKFDFETSKYPNHYTPITRSERKQFHQDLRKLIADRLKRKRK